MSKRLIRVLLVVRRDGDRRRRGSFWFRCGTPLPLCVSRALPAETEGVFEWTPLAKAPLTRYEAGVVELDGNVYVFGGFYNDQTQVTRTVHVYETKSNRWTARGEMPDPFTHANAARIGRSVWFAGGFVEIIPAPRRIACGGMTSTSDSWHAGPPLPEERAAGALVALDGILQLLRRLQVGPQVRRRRSLGAESFRRRIGRRLGPPGSDAACSRAPDRCGVEWLHIRHRWLRRT